MVADDHPIVLQGLQHLLERQPDFEVVATCADGVATIGAVRAQRPDVLLLDLRMPGHSGLDVLRALNQHGLRCRTVLLTAAVTDEEVLEAVRLGATGLVLKESTPETLLACIRRVHEGGEWIDRDTASRAVRVALGREEAARVITETLTPRELEIVRMVAQGLRNRVIGERLVISESTAKYHLTSLLNKLGADNRTQAVAHATQQGLL